MTARYIDNLLVDHEHENDPWLSLSLGACERTMRGAGVGVVLSRTVSCLCVHDARYLSRSHAALVIGLSLYALKRKHIVPTEQLILGQCHVLFLTRPPSG